MGIAALSKHVPHLLIVAIFVLATCSAHSSGGHSSRRQNSGSRRIGGARRIGGGSGNIGGGINLNLCYDIGLSPCHASGPYDVRCYGDFDLCDGIATCPYGEDEDPYYCGSLINPASTVFSVHTTTTTSTSTTTTTSTSSSTTHTTVHSTITVTSTSSRKVRALIPWVATSSTSTTSVTTTISYLGLMTINPVAGAANFGFDGYICQDFAAHVGQGVAGAAGVISASLVTSTALFTKVATVSCSTSGVSYTLV